LRDIHAREERHLIPREAACAENVRGQRRWWFFAMSPPSRLDAISIHDRLIYHEQQNRNRG
jgi:hypothetical protein